MEQTILRAIAERRLLAFTYHQLPRVVEPHVYGVSHNTKQLLAYQLDGASQSGDLPEWRRFTLSGISDLTLLQQTFPGARPHPSGQHSSWQQRIAYVA